MRFIGMLVLGVAIGWFARDLTFDKSNQRAERADTNRAASRKADHDAAYEDAREHAKERSDKFDPSKARGDGLGGSGETEPGADGEADAARKAADKEDPLAEMVKTMSKQWKAMSSMFALDRGWKEQLMEAGFDEETAEKIEKLMGDEAGRQIENAMAMMLNEDVPLDADAFYWFLGVGPKMSTDMEKELSLFLSDDELATVRGEVTKKHDKQLKGLADMTVNMMGITDLSDNQRSQIYKVMKGRDMIKEQFVGFAQLTRNRETFKRLASNPDEFGTAISTNMQPMRRSMQSILTPTQMKKYEAFEKLSIQTAKMQMKMMAGFFKQPEGSKAKKPAGQ